MRNMLPLRRRALLTLRLWLNAVLQRIRMPLIRPQILLITGQPGSPKAAEIEARLSFLVEGLDSTLEIRQVKKASLADYLLSAGVASAQDATFTMCTRRLLSWVADLDYDKNPYDGWDLAELGESISRHSWRLRSATTREKFTEHVEFLHSKGPRPVYLFGTGPSLQKARERSFADGTTIVCNTIVRDSGLWDHLAPAFLTAGDAIYHFGHNPHARAFRADALKRLQESEGRTMFVYPAQFDTIVLSEFRSVASSLVPIPIGMHTDVTVDLVREHSLPKLGNVLNELLLPLGCTVSNDVRLWGFDGRAPKDSGFWANSNRQAYPELLQTIRDAHPAFFSQMVPKGRESQYVQQVHGDLLDERMTDAEGRGFRFQMLHESWTPTLQKRYKSA